MKQKYQNIYFFPSCLTSDQNLREFQQCQPQILLNKSYIFLTQSMKNQESSGSENGPEPLLQLQQKNTKAIQKYKKRLLVQVITIFSICLVIILERVFYQVIVEEEQKVLSDFQLDSGLIKQVNQQYETDGISEGILQFYGDLSNFQIQFLIVTHVIASLYVAYSAFIAAKVLYVTMGIIYLVSVLQMLYSGARPFWTDKGVLSSSCLQSYNHPSIGLILMLFMPIYIYYCSNKKVGRAFMGTIPQKHLILGTVLLLVTLFVNFLNYFLGLMYIINIIMSLIFVLLLFMCLVAANSLLENLLKKSTILKTDAKKYVFYWLLLICLLETFVLIVYSGQDLFLDIDWVQNYMKCTTNLDYPKKNYRFDEVVGPWFNFVQTSSVFAWIGGIFGISACFRKIQSFQWYGGSMKQRIYRLVITNLFIIPSWIFSLLLVEKGQWIKDIGLNTFIVDGIHYFILYFWIFGYMPILVLHKALKITHKESDDEYVIIQNK